MENLDRPEDRFAGAGIAPGTFRITERDSSSRARNGILALAHGPVETPVFMPVGTGATVKAMTADWLEEIGFSIILANTYHLFLRPGPEVIDKAGGLHGFSKWKKNFLTDSGGFQVFSLSPFRKISEEGVTFRSHIDGSLRFLGPVEAVELQTVFQSDIMMQLDVCTPHGAERAEAERAVRLSSAWASRSKGAWGERSARSRGVLFPIMQGNFFRDLRERSAREIVELDLPGNAIGGLSVGEPFEVFADYLAFSAALLPEAKPRYLMGIGTPEYILEAIGEGIDMFDCVFPTRTARNGLLFTRDGPIAIKKLIHEKDSSPIDAECSCRVCGTYSRSYLRHLYRSGEILYAMLATYHNLAFLQDLVLSSRKAIRLGEFSKFKKSFLLRYAYGEVTKA